MSATPDLLRAAALAALGPHGDARARAVLEQADVALDRDVASWEGTAGHVRAHRVEVRVAAETLALVDRFPGVLDDLRGAFGAAIAAHPLEAVAEVTVGWNGCIAAARTAYRGTAPRQGDRSDPDFLREAVRAYLTAAGSDAAAWTVMTGRVEVLPGSLTMVLPVAEMGDRREYAALAEAMRRALAALCAHAADKVTLRFDP